MVPTDIKVDRIEISTYQDRRTSYPESEVSDVAMETAFLLILT